MSSLFQDRLNKLVSGFSKIVDAPFDVMTVVENLLSIDNIIELDQISPMFFELSVDKFAANVIGKDNIKKYKINYYEMAATAQNKKDITSEKIRVSNLLDLENKYVAFTEFPNFNKRKPRFMRNRISFYSRDSLYHIQITALDADGITLLDSRWINYKSTEGEIAYIIKQTTVKSYFNEKLDNNKNGSIVMDEWISRMQTLDEDNEFTVQELKRVFHLILFRGGDLLKIVEPREYKGVYNRMNRFFHARIPDLLEPMVMPDI